MITTIYGEVTPNLIAAKDALCIVVFTPAELKSKDAGKHRADTLISSCKVAGKRGHGAIILSYAYDDDPREIYEIPEIICHIKMMLSDFPALLYFIHDDIEILRPILLCVYDCKVTSPVNGMATIEIPDIARARKTSLELQSAVLSYAESVGDPRGGTDTINIIKSLGV